MMAKYSVIYCKISTNHRKGSALGRLILGKIGCHILKHRIHIKTSTPLQANVSLLQEQGPALHAPSKGEDRGGHRGHKGNDRGGTEAASVHRSQV